MILASNRFSTVLRFPCFTSLLYVLLREEILFNEDLESAYNENKAAPYKLISTDDSIILPEKMREPIRHFSNRKTKENFLKMFNRETEATQSKLHNKEAVQVHRDTYQKGQMLGTNLTIMGLDKFEEEFTKEATTQASKSAPTTQISPNTIGTG